MNTPSEPSEGEGSEGEGGGNFSLYISFERREKKSEEYEY